jgi:hypothetical protein
MKLNPYGIVVTAEVLIIEPQKYMVGFKVILHTIS